MKRIPKVGDTVYIVPIKRSFHRYEEPTMP